jgi:anthranilate phosphoribosyltransferase
VDAWVFRGDDGLDELTTSTTSSVWVVRGGEVTTATVDPQAFGISLSPAEALRGGDAAHNAAVVGRVLEGEQGAVRDAVLLNAGAALAVYDASDAPVDEALAAGLERARESIDSGAAKATLERWITASAG